MELTHRFTVPLPVEETWAHFEDVGSVAECFPGAQVTSADGDSFAGSVKVKLGPIALVYNGSGTFVEKDEAARRFVVDAKGKDKRGNGTAGAHVTVTMADVGGATDVAVETDLAITGKPAQFGRGVMQDVSDKLLGQFVTCLEQRLAPGAGEPAPAEQVEQAQPVTSQSVTSERVASVPLVSGPTEPPAAEREDVADESDPPGERPATAETSIDLGATVLPALARAYWKPALAVGVTLVALRRLLRR